VECHASNIQGYLQLWNVKDKLLQQSNGLHTVLSKIANVSVRYDSKTNLYVNSLCDVSIAGVTFPSHSVAADNFEYLMHDIPQSLVPGYILKSLYVLTLLLSPGLGLFPVLSSFPLLDLHIGPFLLCQNVL
jgi:hypothetical protein